MLHLLDRFRRHTAGNVAITFGLMMIPIVGMVGAAIDYSNANRIRTWLIAAADAASVGAVVKSSAAMTAAAAMSGDGPIPVGATEAINIFNAQIAGKAGFKLSSVTATVEKFKNAVKSTVQFSADVPTFVLGALGKKTFSIGSMSTAANGMPPFVDFYLLLDNTPSMGVAATPADIDKMVKNTPDQCAFACHNLDDPKDNYYKLAKKLGVTMRIDVLRQATEQLMDTAEATETIKNQFRMAIYTFASSCTSPGLTTIKALTSSLSSAKSAAKNIDLMTIPYQGYANDQCTNFEDVMTDINKGHCQSGQRRVGVVAAEVSLLRLRRRGRFQQSGLVLTADRPHRALPGADRSRGLHRDQGPRHQDRRAVHDLSAAADQSLLQQVDRAVHQEDRPGHAELRLARALFRGQPVRGHLGCDERAVPEGAGPGTPDQVAAPHVPAGGARRPPCRACPSGVVTIPISI
jgi:Flp pilus assembly protein TadG